MSIASFHIASLVSEVLQSTTYNPGKIVFSFYGQLSEVKHVEHMQVQTVFRRRENFVYYGMSPDQELLM